MPGGRIVAGEVQKKLPKDFKKSGVGKVIDSYLTLKQKNIFTEAGKLLSKDKPKPKKK